MASGRRKALIVANDEYQNPGLKSLLSPAVDAAALEEVLANPGIGAFDVVDVKRNQASSVIGERVEDFLSDAHPDDMLLMHFSCHGLKNDPGVLFFAAINTRPDRLNTTAVPAELVRECMQTSRARSIVLLLDCCFGGAFSLGKAARAGGSVNVQDSFPGTRIGRGRAVITASTATQYAFEENRLTAGQSPRPSVFTRAVVDGLRTGEADRDKDGWVSLNDLYEYLLDQINERNPHQTPTWQLSMQDTSLYIARNPHGAQLAAQGLVTARPVTARLVTTEPTTAPPGEQARQLLRHAERVAGQIRDPADQAFMFTRLAAELTDADPGHGQELLQRAERLIADSADPIRKARALAGLAEASRPDQQLEFLGRALDVARGAKPNRLTSILKKDQADDAMETAAAASRAIAVAIARALPDRAVEIAKSITAGWRQDDALRFVAVRLAGTSPERALEIARDIGDFGRRAEALRDIVSLIAEDDPAWAEELLGGIAPDGRDTARRAVAVGFATRDADRAVRAAQAIGEDEPRWDALGAVAIAVVQGPSRSVKMAERIVGQITAQPERVAALAGIAAVIAKDDAARAKEILATAENLAVASPEGSKAERADTVSALCAVAIAAALVDPSWSQRLVAEAEKTARLLKGRKGGDGKRYSTALTTVGAALAATDIEGGKKLIDEGKDALEDFSHHLYRVRQQKFSAAVEIIARSDPERAKLIALRLLTDDYGDQTAALRAIALGQATTSLIAAERTAGHIQEPIEQAATLIHLASGQRSSAHHVDTEVPKIPVRLNFRRLKYLRESSRPSLKRG